MFRGEPIRHRSLVCFVGQTLNQFTVENMDQDKSKVAWYSGYFKRDRMKFSVHHATFHETLLISMNLTFGTWQMKNMMIMIVIILRIFLRWFPSGIAINKTTQDQTKTTTGMVTIMTQDPTRPYQRMYVGLSRSSEFWNKKLIGLTLGSLITVWSPEMAKNTTKIVWFILEKSDFIPLDRNETFSFYHFQIS